MPASKLVMDMGKERVAEVVEAAISRFGRSVLPIYDEDDTGRLSHVGSCVLIEIKKIRFLVTAAHIVRPRAKSIPLYVLGAVSGAGAEIPPIPLEFYITQKLPGAQSDRYDFAFARVSDDLAAKLGDVDFVTEDEMNLTKSSTAGRVFLCLGFPNSKNKKIWRGKIKPKRLPYWSTAIAPDQGLLRKLEVSGVEHVFIGFDRKKSADRDGRITTSPSPVGMSGGAVVELGEMSGLAGGEAEDRPQLAGIVIEFHRTYGAIVATRFSAIVQAIRPILMAK